MIFLLAIVAADSTDHPIVQTSKATIVGRRINIQPYQLPDFRKTVLAYTRLPYAEPPVGPLRFSLPVPMSLAGRVDGTRQSVACPQLLSLFFQVDLEQSEDCLYLDIYSPDPKPTSAPVMVWIHGGGYHFGAGSLPESIPTVLSAFGEVIVVTINYRLGPLGFLTTGDDTIPANLGLWDQRQALVWVQTYIQAFGGDPTQVTIFGESAGSASVNMHLVSAMSAGLFSRAIMQSGALNTVWTHHLDKSEAIDAAFEFGKEMGCSNVRSDDLLQCLRKTSLEDFFAAYKDTFPLFSKYFFRPVADDHFLLGDPLQLTKEGKFNPASVIIGCLESEGSLHLMPGISGIQGNGRPFVNSSLFPRIMTSQTGIQDSLLLDMIANVFMSDGELQSQEPDYAPAIIRYIGDSFHKCPTITLSNRLAETGMEVYAFVMDHVPSHSRR
ncbi:cholinesterase 1-like [Diadema antillarum]|uniref:cholinesterase 1-like n=1 Tax=Diadema antillarum TaxID=105358 RepID=UPI003A855EBE